MIVDRFDRRDAVDRASEIRRLRAGALDAEDHVRGGERRAVMKSHVRAQLELPGRWVQRLPHSGELRNDREVGIDVEQRLVDLLGCPLVVFHRIRMRIHGGRTSVLTREPQHVLRRGRAGDCNRNADRQSGDK